MLGIRMILQLWRVQILVNVNMGVCSSVVEQSQEDFLYLHLLPELAELVRQYAFESPPLRVRSVWKLQGQYFKPQLASRDGSVALFMDPAVGTMNHDSRIVCISVETGTQVWATSILPNRSVEFTNFVESEHGTFLLQHKGTAYELDRPTGALLRRIALPSSQTRLFATNKGDALTVTEHGIIQPLTMSSTSRALDVASWVHASTQLRPEQLGWNYFNWRGLVFFADGTELSLVVCPESLCHSKFLSLELCVTTGSKIELFELSSIDKQSRTRTFVQQRRFDLEPGSPRFYRDCCFFQEIMYQGAREWLISLVYGVGVGRLHTGTGKSWHEEPPTKSFIFGNHQIGQRGCLVESKQILTLELDPNEGSKLILFEKTGEITRPYCFEDTLFVYSSPARKWTMIQ